MLESITISVLIGHKNYYVLPLICLEWLQWYVVHTKNVNEVLFRLLFHLYSLIQRCKKLM